MDCWTAQVRHLTWEDQGPLWQAEGHQGAQLLGQKAQQTWEPGPGQHWEPPHREEMLRCQVGDQGLGPWGCGTVRLPGFTPLCQPRVPVSKPAHLVRAGASPGGRGASLSSGR